MLSLTVYVNNINERVNPKKVRYVLGRLFERYGPVIEIHTSPSLQMKGQAFVTYEHGACCQKALTKLHNRPMFKKPLHLSMAKADSDVFRLKHGELAKVEQRKKEKQERRAALSKDKRAELKIPLTKAQIRSWTALPPNSILLLQNIPESHFENGSLELAFGGFGGFSKIRPLPFRKLAFIDFDTESLATRCLDTIDRSALGLATLLTYAKK